MGGRIDAASKVQRAQGQVAVQGYAALCYHYIRPPKARDPFPRILGTPIDEFRKHLDLLSETYAILSPGDARAVSYGRPASGQRQDGVLLTFDDGLADHYQAAQELAERGLAGLFFLPTCILQDGLPANPTILHYAIARYGLERFLDMYRAALEVEQLSRAAYDVPFRRGQDNPWAVIAQLKARVTYQLAPQAGRRLLIEIYRRSLLRDDPDVLANMHLSGWQVREMVAMGHVVGVHSRSHVSVAASHLDEATFTDEVVEPKRYLEREFATDIYAFSYPFGEAKDCLAWERLLERTRAYELAFTAQPRFNRSGSSPFELGRHLPRAADTAQQVEHALGAIICDGASTR